MNQRGPSKMTKQTNEVITPQTILHRFELYNNYIENLRKANLEAGLDVKRNNDFVPQGTSKSARSI